MEHVATTNVVDVTDANFQEVVIEGSKERPVVVDLWASWCAPCRTLGPILEKVAEDRRGAFLLAKLDIDANGVGQALLQAVKSQGIPTVVAFRDGQAVDMFIGAYPEPAVNEFVDRLMPTQADLEASEAEAEEEAGDLEDAEAKYREVLETDPNNRAAGLGLGRILAQQGAASEARQVLMPLLPDPDAEKLLAEIEVRSWAALSETSALASAKRLAAQGTWREALDGMIGALGDDPDARQAMLEVFTALGDEDPLVPEFRRKLASNLF